MGLALPEAGDGFLCEGDPVNVYPFIEAEKQGSGGNVKRACELLKVSRAACYAARDGQSCDRDRHPPLPLLGGQTATLCIPHNFGIPPRTACRQGSKSQRQRQLKVSNGSPLDQGGR